MSILSKLFHKKNKSHETTHSASADGGCSNAAMYGTESETNREHRSKSSPIPFYKTRTTTASPNPSVYPSNGNKKRKSPNSLPPSEKHLHKGASRFFIGGCSNSEQVSCSLTAALHPTFNDNCDPNLHEQVIHLQQQLREKDATVSKMTSKYLMLKKEMKITRQELRKVRLKLATDERRIKWNYQPQQISEQEFLEISVTPASARAHKPQKHSRSVGSDSKRSSKDQSLAQHAQHSSPMPDSTVSWHTNDTGEGHPTATTNDARGKRLKKLRESDTIKSGKDTTAEPCMIPRLDCK
uniref:Uncharacterized protein n=1 Tax=Percolomonas cosmopolitus TaxID=63605 RepID=A0A7S1KMS8_9EUKA|mmetsp:Transcript_2033/g.7289  ORF Transcript_2033/g.7289 Transcript_2033/m.7289 type:complete len:296 (+) Transcript_2033:314-1201(+)